MSAELEGKSAIAFGAARGIGAATVKALVDAGAHVTAADVLDDVGAEFAASLPAGRARYAHADVSDAEQIHAAYAGHTEAFGGVDIVFNNVGIARYGTVDRLSLEDWELTLRTNLTAQFISCQVAIPLLRERGGGTIVNTASVLAHGSQKTTAAYAASKAGVMGLTRTVAIDHAHEGIRAVSISPGTIDTPLVRISADTFEGRDPEELKAEWAAAHPMDRLGTAEEVAQLVLFLVSDRARFITGSDIPIDGGIRSELYR